MKKMRKSLAMLLALILVIGLLPTSALAANDETNPPVVEQIESEDQQAGDEDQQAGDEDQQAGDDDQQAGDEDQQAGDEDQQAGDEDQQAGDEDQQAGDEDQQAGDEDQQAGDDDQQAGDDDQQAGDDDQQAGDDDQQAGDEDQQAGDDDEGETAEDNSDVSAEGDNDKEDEEAQEPALIYQTISVTAEDGAVITIGGFMPEGAYVTAIPVTVELEGVEGITVLAAYDITIYDANGNVFQPADGGVSVSISSPVVEEAEDISVYHMEDEDDAEPEKISVSSVSGEEVSFTAESFSIYVVAGYNFFGGIIEGPSEVKVGSTIELWSDCDDHWFTQNHSWSSNTSVATVVFSGDTATLTGKSAGSVTITHTYQYYHWGWKNASDTKTITVLDNVVVSVTPSSTTIDLDSGTTTAQLSAAVTKNGVADAPAITWSSSNSSVATVDSSTGLVTGVAKGSATITATCAYNGTNYTGTASITVNQTTYSHVDVKTAAAVTDGSSGLTVTSVNYVGYSTDDTNYTQLSGRMSSREWVGNSHNLTIPASATVKITVTLSDGQSLTAYFNNASTYPDNTYYPTSGDQASKLRTYGFSSVSGGYNISGASVFLVSSIVCNGSSVKSGSITADGLDLVLNVQTLINYSVSAMTTVTVTKNWTTTGDSNPPSSLTVQLQKNGVDYGSSVILTATSTPAWTYTWTDLPNDGSTYTVVETVPTNYTQGTTVTGDKALVLNSCEIVNPCNVLSFSDLSGIFVVVKKGGTTIVWTLNDLGSNKQAFVDAFNAQGGSANSLGLDINDSFYSGLSASISGVTINGTAKTLTFSTPSAWSKFAYGIYDDAGKTITLNNTYVPPTVRVYATIDHGTITAGNDVAVTTGENSTVTYSVAEGYRLVSISVNGTALTGDALTAASDGSVELTNILVETTVQIVTEKIPLIVTYNIMGTVGTAPASDTVDWGTAYPETSIKTADSVAGYTFNGWYTSSDLTGDKYSGTDALTANLNLYGEFVRDTGTLTITKTFVGLTEAQVEDMTSFAITCGDVSYTLETGAKVVNSDTSITYTWDVGTVNTGSYSATETGYTAPAGYYCTTTSETATASEEVSKGENAVISLSNTYGELGTGSITINKLGADEVKDTSIPLGGIVFTLKDSTGGTTTATTDSNGMASFANLTAGTYTLMETTGAQGYTLNSETYYVVVEVNQSTATTTVYSDELCSNVVELVDLGHYEALQVVNWREYGVLSIAKDVAGALSESNFTDGDFEFTVTDESGNVIANVSLPEKNNAGELVWETSLNVPTGTYQVVEASHADLTNYTCAVSYSTSNQEILVANDSNGTITCTNTYTYHAPIVIIDDVYYTVTVNYLNENGGTIHGSYSSSFLSGSSYNVSAAANLTIDGYTYASMDGGSTSGTINGNIIINVHYTTDTTDIEDEETPLNPTPEEPEQPAEEPEEPEQSDEEPAVEIPDEEVPMGSGSEGTETSVPQQPVDQGNSGQLIIIDQPAGNLPQTGTMTTAVDPTATAALLALAFSMAAIGLCYVLTRKKDEEPDEF